MKSILLTSSSSSTSSESTNSQKENLNEILKADNFVTYSNSSNNVCDSNITVINSTKLNFKNNNELINNKRTYSDNRSEKRWQKSTIPVKSDYESHPLIETASKSVSIGGGRVEKQTSTSKNPVNLSKKNGATLILQKRNNSLQKLPVVDGSEYRELKKESFTKRHSVHWPPYKRAISSHFKQSIEEELEDSALTHLKSDHNNLAETIIASSLLSINDENVPANIMKTSSIESPAATGATSKRWKLEQFLKSLVGKRSAQTSPPANSVIESIKVNKSPSAYDLLQQQKSSGDERGSTLSLNKNRLINKSTTSLNSTSLALVHQKLWSVVPLLSRKDGGGGGASCNNLLLSNENSLPHNAGKMRKCETVLVLTDEKQQHKLQPSTSSSRTHSKSINNLLDPLPMRPLNRLRNSQSCYVNCDSNTAARQTQNCSRCSSLLSLAAIGGSSYSLKNGAFVLKNGRHLNRHANKHQIDEVTENDCSNHNLIENDFNSIEPYDMDVVVTLKEQQINASTKFTCKLCLGEYFNEDKLTTISSCGCTFCTECMRAYVEFEISEGAYELSCPDALCSSQGVVSLAEISQLASTSLVAKHHRYRLNREVELDKTRLWCPNRNCETICSISMDDKLSPSTSSQSAVLQPSSSSTANLLLPRPVLCPSCSLEFCSSCKKAWHPQISCDENSKRLGSRTNSLMLFDNDLIKMCPMCSVPIEKDEGCAQMMCKRCKHVFCWYCLASLDDDFLLRHYDKGPCKNKLGHSRASVVWHRAQVIGIFAGFGILLLVASPLLLLAAPCIVCCKCKIEESTTAAKLDEHPDHQSDHQV